MRRERRRPNAREWARITSPNLIRRRIRPPTGSENAKTKTNEKEGRKMTERMPRSPREMREMAEEADRRERAEEASRELPGLRERREAVEAEIAEIDRESLSAARSKLEVAMESVREAETERNAAGEEHRKIVDRRGQLRSSLKTLRGNVEAAERALAEAEQRT